MFITLCARIVAAFRLFAEIDVDSDKLILLESSQTSRRKSGPLLFLQGT